MPYIERITKAGRTIDVERYYSARYGKRGQKRATWTKVTPDEQKKINNRRAETKLRRILNANFTSNDYHVVLSYQKARGEKGRDPNQMKDDIARFLRQLRKEYKARGDELKYVHVPEIGSHGARHHHLVLNQIPPDVIAKCWPHGRIHLNPLDTSGEYRQLAAYLLKYTSKTIGSENRLSGKRWNASRNLIHPESEIKIITEREWFRTEARVPKRFSGRYYIDKSSIQSGVSSPEYNGYGYFRFTMVRLC